MSHKILIATHNKNKLAEFQQILPKIKFISLSDLGDDEEFIEDGQTLEENSYLKADYYFTKYQMPTIADDTGLEVYALNNRPGVHSQRYSGGDDSDNNTKLLNELSSEANRQARFRCVLTYFASEDEIIQFDGILEGEIAKEVKGDAGFGYDPIFVIPSKHQTVAELGMEFKNSYSHRAEAVKLFKEYLDENSRN